MRSIPNAIATDAEDVIWALQTADALWKRQERIDAIVWLRRAAQAAGEAEDDDRALELARGAAELAEWIANNPGAATGAATPTTAPPAAGEAVDDLLLGDPADEVNLEEPTPVMDQEVVTVPPPAAPRSPVPAPRSPMPPPASAPAPARVLTAAEAHAGMLDPWGDPEAPTRNRPHPPALDPVAPPAPATPKFEFDEVVTSAPPVSTRTFEVKPAGPPAPPARSAPLQEPSPAPSRPRSPPPPSRAQPPPARVQPPPRPPPPPLAADTRAPEPPAQPTKGAIDLSQVEALSDLPDDARAAFAVAAKVQVLAREDEVSGFALALVLEGEVDVSATIVDAAAQRMGPGAVMRARGTIEQFAPVRLIGASPSARVATWDEQAVTEAFRTCPWVEDELRAAGDRLQALVGITMGPLGERLDATLRADVMSRLQLRALAEHEVITTKGGATVGLLVVGGGELELLGDDGAPSGAVLHPGEFLFPNESLRAAPAPSTVRASRGGALVLLAERGVAQELLVTCPPLLEIFAGM
jgi:hypothetical protein